MKKCQKCGSDYSDWSIRSSDLSDIWFDLSFEKRFVLLAALQYCCENCFSSYLNNLKKGLKNG